MSLSTLGFVHRGPLLVAACATCCFLASNEVCSQETVLSLTGVNEGAVIMLPAGVTTNLAFTASVSPPAGSANVAWLLEHQGAIRQSFASPPPYALTFSNLPAGKYFLRAHLETETNTFADVSFDIAMTSLQPANDDWSNAAVVPSIGVSMAASNLHATCEVNEPIHAGNSGGRSVWWRWQAPSNGWVTVTTAGSSFDTALAVYSGSNLATLDPVGANDDAGWTTNAFSQASFPAVAGSYYFFAVDGAVSPAGAAASGMVQLRVLAGAPPMVTINPPTDGLALIVPSQTATTNATATMAITDPTGIAEVQYWFDGDAGSRQGILLPPYQLNLTNLTVGDYWLTVAAVNGQGLIASTHAGLSVVTKSGQVLLVDTPALYTNGFRLAVTGLKGPAYTLQGSTNLEVWCTIRAWTNFAGVEKVVDTNAALFGRRFYRTLPQ